MQTNSHSNKKNVLPRRVRVEAIALARYEDSSRPLSWDQRKEGIEEITTADGEKLKLFSDGGQSTPQPGWVLLLTEGDAAAGYRWTLYGIPPAQ